MSLSSLNLGAAILHLSLAIGFTIYFPIVNAANPNNPVTGIELTIRDHVLQLSRNEDLSVTANWISKVLQNPDISVVQTLCVLFFFITGGFHLFYYADSEYYQSMIGQQNNYLRWIEYSITSTLMLYIISLLCGVKDTKIYQLLWAMNIGMIAQGQLIEAAVHKGESWWIPMATGFILLLAEWSVILRDYLNRIHQVNIFIADNPTETTQQVPAWISAMVFLMFFFYATFGFISLYGAYQGNGYDYEQIERLYIVFSFIAKATLGIFVAYGIAQRQQGVGGSAV